MNDRLTKVLDEYKRLGIAEQIDYDKFYLYSLITHSTAIEGSTVTEIENQLLFDEGITAKGRTMQEQMMNLDLKRAYEHSIRLAKEHTPFSVEMLRGLSAIVMKNTGSSYNTVLGSFDASQGDLRLVNVSAGFGGSSYMDFHKVPAALEGFCQWLNERRRVVGKDVVAQYNLSFDAHLRLVTIHPWVDGNVVQGESRENLFTMLSQSNDSEANGRMSRLVMNHLQFEYGLVPVRVNKENRAEYIAALVASREAESPEPFRRFMLNEHIANLEREMAEYTRQTGGQKIAEVDRKGGQKTREVLLQMIADDPTVTTTQMASALGINRSAVSKHLDRLKADGRLRRVGPDKGGHWELLM